MIYYITLDTGSKALLFDSYDGKRWPVVEIRPRKVLQEYINDNNLDVISVHESHLPTGKIQLVAWYRYDENKSASNSRHKRELNSRGNKESLS